MFNRSYILSHKGHRHYLSDVKFKSLQKNFSKISESNDLLLVMKNLSDPTKLNIYLLLARLDEVPVTDIVNVLEISHSAVSHALSDLRKINLIESRRCGQLKCYFLKKQSSKRKAFLSGFNYFKFIKKGRKYES